MGKWTVLNSHNHGLLTVSGYVQMKSVKTQYSEVLTDGLCISSWSTHWDDASKYWCEYQSHEIPHFQYLCFVLWQCEWCSKWLKIFPYWYSYIYVCAFQDIHRLHSPEPLVMGYVVYSFPIDAALGVWVNQWTHPLSLVMIWLRTLDKVDGSAYNILVGKYDQRDCLWDVVVGERMQLRSVLKM